MSAGSTVPSARCTPAPSTRVAHPIGKLTRPARAYWKYSSFDTPARHRPGHEEFHCVPWAQLLLVCKLRRSWLLCL